MQVESPAGLASSRLQASSAPAAESVFSTFRAEWLIAVLALPTIALFMLIDRPVATWVHEAHFSTGVRELLVVLRQPGNYVFTIVLAFFLWWRRFLSQREFVALLLITGAACIVEITLKWCLGRTRPFKGAEPFDWKPFRAFAGDFALGENLSFPSGDATLAFATAAVLTRFLPRTASVVYIWAGVVAVTRVLQGVHYPSDVVGGAIVGTLCARLSLQWLERRSNARALAPTSAAL